ncbi:MAG: thermonuclease family protein [Gammaproteobacteria bacterium]|nr:thermonuclease family protein [Gammaproteobacteria bacterium]
MPVIQHVIQKAPFRAPFVFLPFLLFILFTAGLCAATQSSQCKPATYDERAKVAHVYDGDTIELTDGRKIRLIGVNTPERGHDGDKDEPFYLEAKKHLQQLLKQSQGQIYLTLGQEQRDHYKRTLAHIFTLSGENISATLIQRGLGFSITVPPNLRFLNCYQDAEQSAQKSKRGIWQSPHHRIINAVSLTTSSSGFHRINGKIKRIGESKSFYWLNLETSSNINFALRIPKKDMIYFVQYHPKNLLHQYVTARGWVSLKNGELRMTIHHPASLQRQKI